MNDLKLGQCILSGNVLSISKSKENVSRVNLKTFNYTDGKLSKNRGITIIVHGDIGALNINDPIAFIGKIIPDKFNRDTVCMMAYAENSFVPEEW